MTQRSTLTREQVADRIEIRELVDAYARYADRREPEKQYALYAPLGRTLVYAEGPESEPQVLKTAAEHLAGFAALARYAATTHFNGQCTIELDGDEATAETYCLAHHILDEGGQRTLIVMSIRYEDVLMRTTEGWRFEERKLVIDWTDSRASQP
jgi:hypothetical protein